MQKTLERNDSKIRFWKHNSVVYGCLTLPMHLRHVLFASPDVMIQATIVATKEGRPLTLSEGMSANGYVRGPHDNEIIPHPTDSGLGKRTRKRRHGKRLENGNCSGVQQHQRSEEHSGSVLVRTITGGL